MDTLIQIFLLFASVWVTLKGSALMNQEGAMHFFGIFLVVVAGITFLYFGYKLIRGTFKLF